MIIPSMLPGSVADRSVRDRRLHRAARPAGVRARSAGDGCSAWIVTGLFRRHLRMTSGGGGLGQRERKKFIEGRAFRRAKGSERATRRR